MKNINLFESTIKDLESHNKDTVLPRYFVKMRKEFTKFLNDKGALEEFVEEFKRYEKMPEFIDSEAIPYLKEGSPRDYVDTGLYWAVSNLGQDYWYNINSDWKNEYDALIEKAGGLDSFYKHLVETTQYE